MGHTIRLTTVTLAESIELTKRFDSVCFTEEMRLGRDEWELLLESGAEATILFLDNKVIGQAITIREAAVAAPLSEADTLFFPDARGIYSYSEAILPAYQRKGYGSLLVSALAVKMRERHHTRMSAHVRTRFGWHQKRSRILSVTAKRLVDDFWEDPRDRKVEFQTVLLA